jgi:uncharacterized membrane protein YhaH (DUF805 family)
MERGYRPVPATGRQPGNLPRVTVVRIVIALIITAMVGVALVPMLVLLDLAAGGGGLGICHGSLDSCRAGYFEGPELLAMLALVLLLLLMLLRLAWVVRRRLADRQRSVSRGERLGSG